MPNINSEPELVVSDFRRTQPSNLHIVDHPLIVGNSRVGIEIELENMQSEYSRPTGRGYLRHWALMRDESLRNSGVEYITKGDGIGGDVLYNACVEINSHLSRLKPDPSWRCSTHIHLDVRDLNYEELKRTILAYVFYEKFIFRSAGWNRYKSNFCVPIGVAQTQIGALSEAMSQNGLEGFILRVRNNWNKYTAINLLPIRDLGTLEFRMSEPTYKLAPLVKLANLFLSLKVLAQDFNGSDFEFLEHLATLPIEGAFPKSLGRSSKFLNEDLSDGYKLALDILSLRSLQRKTSMLKECE